MGCICEPMGYLFSTLIKELFEEEVQTVEEEEKYITDCQCKGCKVVDHSFDVTVCRTS